MNLSVLWRWSKSVAESGDVDIALSIVGKPVESVGRVEIIKFTDGDDWFVVAPSVYLREDVERILFEEADVRAAVETAKFWSE